MSLAAASLVRVPCCRYCEYLVAIQQRPSTPLPPIPQHPHLRTALGLNRAYHYADVFGAAGQKLGRIRYGFSFRKGMDSLVKEYRSWSRTKRPSEPDQRDPALQAVQKVSRRHAWVGRGGLT